VGDGERGAGVFPCSLCYLLPVPYALMPFPLLTVLVCHCPIVLVHWCIVLCPLRLFVYALSCPLAAMLLSSLVPLAAMRLSFSLVPDPLALIPAWVVWFGLGLPEKRGEYKPGEK